MIKAIAIIPQSAGVYANRGNTKKRIGDLRGACRDWRKAADLGHERSAEWVRKQC